MSLNKLTKFVILIWLPLASFKVHHKEIINKLVLKKTDVSGIKDEEKTVVENFTKTLEENSFKNRTDTFKSGDVTSENYSTKISAKSLNLLHDQILNSMENFLSAHKVKTSVKKDLSAVIRNEDKSATRLKKFFKYKINNTQSRISKRKAVGDISAGEDPHSLEDYEEEEAEEMEIKNSTELGRYLGSPCEETCSGKLHNVFCNPSNKMCECVEKYPVQIDATIGCEQPKQLGDQCFYAETCTFFDPNAICLQINHNAICHCKQGYHAVALRKSVKRMFCSEDVAVVSADLTTLLGVATGIAVLTGLICFVLRLFSGNRYPHTRHYANSNIAPPLLLSNDNQWINGIPLTVHGRPPSRSSCQRSTVSLNQHSRNKGVLVPASRAGAARAAAILLIPCHLQASRHSEVANNSNADDTEVQPSDVEQTSRPGSRRHSFSSVQSTTSSQKSMSYSARRFEQENQQREHRAAMKAAREEATQPSVPFTRIPAATNGIIIPFSKDTEEDPLCDHTEEQPPESEPPAFSITQGNIQPKICPK